MNRAIALVAPLLGLSAACGPIALSPVPQPITCHCPGTTVVLRGQLEEKRGGVATTRAMALVLERSPERIRISLFDEVTAMPVCVMLANLQGAWEEKQSCVDPIDPTGTKRVSMERGVLLLRGDAAELRFDAATLGAETEVGIAGVFVGNVVVVPK